MPDVLLLSRYSRLGASSRVRSLQFLPSLAAQGIDVTVSPLFDDEFLRDRHAQRRIPVARLLSMYLRRIRDVLTRRREAVCWIEYELLPWLPFSVERMLMAGGRPLIVEYDDAWFHRYDQHGSPVVRALLGRKIDRLMRSASLIIAGNEYLAARARAAGARRVEILPSSIDLSRYRQKRDDEEGELVVGWIGSPLTSHALHSLEPSLRRLAQSAPVRVVNIGGSKWVPGGFAVENLAWSETTEVEDLLRCNVGVMPLPDDAWSRGKCGYKLIQYMGCALPVVASPVGANATIVQHGLTGLHATSAVEWTDALATLARSVSLRRTMGQAGFERLKRHYTIDVVAPRLGALLKDVIQDARQR